MSVTDKENKKKKTLLFFYHGYHVLIIKTSSQLIKFHECLIHMIMQNDISDINNSLEVFFNINKAKMDQHKIQFMLWLFLLHPLIKFNTDTHYHLHI